MPHWLRDMQQKPPFNALLINIVRLEPRTDGTSSESGLQCHQFSSDVWEINLPHLCSNIDQ